MATIVRNKFMTIVLCVVVADCSNLPSRGHTWFQSPEIIQDRLAWRRVTVETPVTLHTAKKMVKVGTEPIHSQEYTDIVVLSNSFSSGCTGRLRLSRPSSFSTLPGLASAC